MNELELHISGLSADDFPTRRRSAELLGELGEPAAIKPLLRLLSDDYWQVRNTVVEAIVKIRDKASIAPLVEFLRDEDPGLRNSSMSVLHEMGEDVVPPLTKLLLADKSEDVRIFCANTLGRMREPKAVVGLVKGLSDRDENVRFACAEGLGRLGRGEAVSPLIEAMNKEVSWARFSYITALGLIGDELACPALLGMMDDEILALPSIISLGQIGDLLALGPLVEKFRREVDDLVLRALVVAIARIEKRTAYFSKVERNGFLYSELSAELKNADALPHLELLVAMALGDDKLESESALNLLRFVQHPIPVERLFPLLSDEIRGEEVMDLILKQGQNAVKPVLEGLRSKTVDCDVNHLINILGLLGSEENIAELGTHLDSPVSETVCDALKAAGMLNGRELLPKMVELLRSPDKNVQQAAFGGIVLLHPREWLYETAIGLASSQDALIRRAGYRILGFSSITGSVDLLLRGLSDEAPDCRAAAMQSLGYIGAHDKSMLKSEGFFGAVSRVLADEEKSVRLEAVLAFGRINSPVTSGFLLDMLGREDRDVQNHVIRAIGRTRSAEAVERLCEMLENHDNTEQAILLCNALGRCGKREAISHLMRFINSAIPELASEAIEAVARIGGEGVAEEVWPYLSSKTWLVTVAAINGLAMLGAALAAPMILKLALENTDETDGPIIVRTALKALAKIGGAGESKVAVKFLEHPAYQYEAFAAVFGILCKEDGRLFDVKEITNPAGRRLACAAAGYSSKDEYKDDVRTRLGDDYPSVRRAAALALSVTQRGSRRAVAPSALEGLDPWVAKIFKKTSMEG